MKTSNDNRHNARCRVVDFAIIGAGLGGLCAAVKLKEAGLGSIVILEKGDGLGGVWRENRYPNIACDTPIDMYSISYFPGDKWTTNFAPGQEILDYLQEFSDVHGVTSLIEFKTEIARAAWDTTRGRWSIEASDGRCWDARYVIWAGGVLSRPLVPKIPGLDTFEGEMFHTTEWNETTSLDGKAVAVVGGGATAIQVVPYAVEHADSVVTFVRTPSYVLPRPELHFAPEDRGGADFVVKLLERRAEWFVIFEKIAEARFPMNRALIAEQEGEWRKYFDSVILDPALREILTPDYRFGCKRPLFSNAYYPALNQPNVTVVGKGVTAVDRHGLIDASGFLHRVDTIVWATGFDPANMLGGLDIRGVHGRSLSETWATLPEAYYGTLVKGFPNLFLINGPNVSGASATEFVEGQVSLIVQALKRGQRANAPIIEVPDDAHDAFNADIQRRAEESVLVLGNCSSWYRASGTGRVFTHWPGTIASFRAAIRERALEGLRFRGALGAVDHQSA